MLRSRTSDTSGNTSDVLQVRRVDFLVEKNAQTHRTTDYDLTREGASEELVEPVLRRGGTFSLVVYTKNRSFDSKEDRLFLTMSFGERPRTSLGTAVNLRVTDSDSFRGDKDYWDVRMQSKTADSFVLEINVPVDALVGAWKCDLNTSLLKGSGGTKFSCPENIYILFNAWNKDDMCYFPEEDKLASYLLASSGKVYVGSRRSYKGRNWAFGQYQRYVLPAVEMALRYSSIKATDRANPVRVVRALTNQLNSNAHRGVLQGRWNGSYEDGTAPWAWTGSGAIFKEYLKNRGESPVLYGQCWVFSAILVTACRALGVPCRSVTNFDSAHDTDGTLTIDHFYDENGNKLDRGPNGDANDSIWNFHVWSEAWMTRPDLPLGYGGWQVVDATPQEMSAAGRFECGPCPAVAVRRGEVGVGFETPFVFAEVNADVVHWIKDKESDWGFSKMYDNKTRVGSLILTQKLEDNMIDFNEDEEDITLKYKYAEGTEMERVAMMNAVRATKEAHRLFDYAGEKEKDVVLDLVDVESVMIGQPLPITINLKNLSDKTRTISAIVHADTCYYNGIRAHTILHRALKFEMKPHAERTEQLEILTKNYMDKLVEYCVVKVFTICKVVETRQALSAEDDFQIAKPKLKIQVHPEKLSVGDQLYVKFSLKNPLQYVLTDLVLRYEISGLLDPQAVKLPSSVAASGEFNYSTNFKLNKAGSFRLVANFECRQLIDIDAGRSLKVSE